MSASSESRPPDAAAPETATAVGATEAVGDAVGGRGWSPGGNAAVAVSGAAGVLGATATGTAHRRAHAGIVYYIRYEYEQRRDM